MLAMPHTYGWAVLYSEKKTVRVNNVSRIVDSNNSCYFRTKEEAEKKADELKKHGAKIRMITEAIY